MLKRRQTLSEIASERIRDYITDYQCQPGDRLPSEKEIIDMLGISRTSVREALKTLQSQGIIEIKQGVGIFVKEIELDGYIKNVSPFLKTDKRTFKELIDSRIVLEVGAIELASQNDRPDQFLKMSNWNERIYEQALKGKKAKEEDLQFHKALFEATGNRTFIQLSSIINEYFHNNQLEEIVDIEGYKRSYIEHQAIIDALVNKETETAKQAMRQHLSHLYDLL